MQDLVDHAIPTAHDLREFTRQLQVYAHATNRPIKRIPLILRSSANLEDLEGMSSAGLYDSISNVTLCMESSTFLYVEFRFPQVFLYFMLPTSMNQERFIFYCMFCTDLEKQ